MARWAMAGPFRRQHDPDLLPNGHIMVFDNLGGDPACGRTPDPGARSGDPGSRLEL